jgi:hypothetical protein
MNRIPVDVDPTAARYMQQEVRRSWDEACRCRIADVGEECYRGKIMFVFETPDESDTAFGYGTSIIHAKCGRPVYRGTDQVRAEEKAGIVIPSEWAFFNR